MLSRQLRVAFCHLNVIIDYPEGTSSCVRSSRWFIRAVYPLRGEGKINFTLGHVALQIDFSPSTLPSLARAEICVLRISGEFFLTSSYQIGIVGWGCSRYRDFSHTLK